MDNKRETWGQQSEVFIESLTIYKRRNEIRSDMWREFPIEENIRQVESKVARAKNALEALAKLKGIEQKEAVEAFEAELLDSCLDGINFLAFTVRQYRESKDA